MKPVHTLISLVAVVMLGAAVTTAAPGTAMSTDEFIRPVTDTHYVAWDDRALGILEAGLEGALNENLYLGAAFRLTGGHGRTATNRYDGKGWQAWGEWHMLPATESRPGLSLFAEHQADAVHLRSATSTSAFTADPTCSSTGGQLRVQGTLGDKTWRTRAGLYRTTVNSLSVATVQFVDAGMDVPLGDHLTLQPTVMAFHDDYEGGRFNGGVRVGLTGSPLKDVDVTLAGSLFARGIPLAGTPLSLPSAVGVNYGSTATTQLHNGMVGYLSLSANYHF